MIEIEKLLLEICEDERVLNPDIDLIESGIIDSLAFIELFTRLEEEGIEIQPTQINRNQLRSIQGIKEMIEIRKEKGNN